MSHGQKCSLDSVVSWDRAGDKAPVRLEAEAKARRYALFSENVDESAARRAARLTALGPK